jgi:ferredoxin
MGRMMGWLFYRKPEDETVREHLDKKMNWESETARYCVLKSAMVGSTYYGAVEIVVKETGKRDVFAVVYLTKSNKRAADGMTFGYKDMDEGCGPCERKCPVGVLDLLTETESAYAKYAESKRIGKPKVGQRIKFPAPISFTDGTKHEEFEVTSTFNLKGRASTVYRALDNGRNYRITNIQRREFAVVEENPALIPS